MKRLLILIIAAVGAAAAIWLGLRASSSRGSTAAVTTLLPADTFAFLHVPDFTRARGQWQQTDLHKLWREPAVQDFLRQPLAKAGPANALQQRIEDLDALGIKDGFVALAAWDNLQPKLVGGFRATGDRRKVESMLESWRSRAVSPTATRTSVAYENHSIDVVSDGTVTLAHVFDRQWFLVANDLEILKGIINRVDGRSGNGQPALAGNADFVAALKHMPAAFLIFGYARIDRYVAELAPKWHESGLPQAQLNALRDARAVAAATTVEAGKIRDTLFVAMPKAASAADLTRQTLSLATADAFLYLASFMSFPAETSPPAGSPPSGRLAGWHRWLAGVRSAGVTAAEWNQAFGPEFGLVGSWPQNARLPSLLVGLPVKDAGAANAVVAKFTAAAGEANPWTISTQSGAQFYSQTPLNPMLPIAPTIAVTDQVLVAGSEASAVESAINRGRAGASALATALTFKAAERLVAAADRSFAYVDTALLYTRLDAALRPMLIMSAAFLPAIGQSVDVAKLPPAEVVTKHLSPLVLSQHYGENGYVTESVGPVSLYQAALGLFAVSGLGERFYQGAAGIIPNAPASPSADDSP